MRIVSSEISWKLCFMFKLYQGNRMASGE